MYTHLHPYLYTLTLNLNPNFFKPTTTLIPITPITIAPIEEEWAIIASKYRYGINIDKAIKDKLVEFVKTIIYIYKTQDLTDNNLWTVF